MASQPVRRCPGRTERLRRRGDERSRVDTNHPDQSPGFRCRSSPASDRASIGLASVEHVGDVAPTSTVWAPVVVSDGGREMVADATPVEINRRIVDGKAMTSIGGQPEHRT